MNFENMLSLVNYISQRDELLVVTFHGASIDFPLIMEDLIWNSNQNNWCPLIVKNKIISILMKRKHIRLIDIENFITTIVDKLVSAFDELKGIQLNYLPYQLVLNKLKKYPMIWNKKYFNYSKFPENLSEDPSQRYTKINFDKWWDSVDKTQEQTIFQYVENLAKTSLNILAKSTNIYRERIQKIYFIDILDFLTKSQFIWHVFTNSIEKYPLIPYIEKSSKQSSTNEIMWLEYMANKLKKRIQHACYLGQK